MGTDEDAAGSGAAAARSFLEQLRGLPSDEKEKAFQAIRDGLAPGERFKLRAALGVAAPDEMTEGAVAARVAEELKNLVASMEADAATKQEGGEVAEEAEVLFRTTHNKGRKSFATVEEELTRRTRRRSQRCSSCSRSG